MGDRFTWQRYGDLLFEAVDPETYEFGKYEHIDELDTKWRFWRGLGPGDLVVDVGASWGGWTLPALAQGAGVVALEPARRSLDVLEESVRRNPGFSGRCETHHALAGDGTPFSEWFRREVFRSFGVDSDRTVRLDDVLGGRRVSRVKVDVEGAELQVLRGMEGVLRRDHPLLVVEDHTSPEPERGLEGVNRDVCRLLRECGYGSVESTRPLSGNPFIVASR